MPQQRLKALAVRFIVPLDELRAERFAAAAAGDGGGQRLLNLQRRDGFAIRDEQVFQLDDLGGELPFNGQRALRDGKALVLPALHFGWMGVGIDVANRNHLIRKSLIAQKCFMNQRNKIRFVTENGDGYRGA